MFDRIERAIVERGVARDIRAGKARPRRGQALPQDCPCRIEGLCSGVAPAPCGGLTTPVCENLERARWRAVLAVLEAHARDGSGRGPLPAAVTSFLLEVAGRVVAGSIPESIRVITRGRRPGTGAEEEWCIVTATLYNNLARSPELRRPLSRLRSSPGTRRATARRYVAEKFGIGEEAWKAWRKRVRGSHRLRRTTDAREFLLARGWTDAGGVLSPPQGEGAGPGSPEGLAAAIHRQLEEAAVKYRSFRPQVRQARRVAVP